VETTSLGAAMLAGVGCGMFATLEEAGAMRAGVRRFEPKLGEDQRQSRLAGWRRAVDAVLLG
jgi:glycerol kinase